MSRQPIPKDWIAYTNDGQEFEIDAEGKVLAPPGFVFKRGLCLTIGPRQRFTITEVDGVRTARVTGHRFWHAADFKSVRVEIPPSLSYPEAQR
jgi:hypothetical protein